MLDPVVGPANNNTAATAFQAQSCQSTVHSRYKRVHIDAARLAQLACGRLLNGKHRKGTLDGFLYMPLSDFVEGGSVTPVALVQEQGLHTPHQGTLVFVQMELQQLLAAHSLEWPGHLERFCRMAAC